MPLREGDKANFATLTQAASNGDLALMQCRRRSDQAEIAVICAANREPDGAVSFVPLAVMVEGNPYDLFDPPNPEGGYEEGRDEL